MYKCHQQRRTNSFRVAWSRYDSERYEQIPTNVYRCKNRHPSLSVAEVLNLRFARSAFSGLVVATVAGLIVNQHFSQDLPLQKIAFRFKLWLVCLSFGLVLWLSLRLLHSCLAKSDEQVLLHTTCKQ